MEKDTPSFSLILLNVIKSVKYHGTSGLWKVILVYIIYCTGSTVRGRLCKPQHTFLHEPFRSPAYEKLGVMFWSIIFLLVREEETGVAEPT